MDDNTGTPPNQPPRRPGEPTASLLGTSPQDQPPVTPAQNPVQAAPKKNRLIIILVSLVLIGLAGSGVYYWYTGTHKPAASAAVPEKNILKVGTIIDENGLAADQKEFTPFINYLATQLRSQGILQARFVPETSVATMAELMRENKVDLYIDSIFPVFVADHLSNAQIIANRWKDGVEKYRTAIFVKSSSSIKTANDLKGKIIAFDSPTSTTGYFLPKAELIKLGYTLTERAKPTDPVAPNEIGYTFVHASVYDDVQNSITQVGAESEQEMRDHFGPSFDQQYRIIATTPYVLRFIVTGRAGLSPSLRAAIKTTLLAMDQSNAGKAILKSFSNTAKFTDVGTDSDAAYGELQNLTSLIENEIVTGGVGATPASQ
ncbi:MAG TPA: PhnD/SsuA/transferrin family substrate-binding protein [Candidatus Acidoferrum sp.]|nr:PhnD/SsuA/transferrin family substrate-binding protein [Candidatus Acidoferrum sp.]